MSTPQPVAAADSDAAASRVNHLDAQHRTAAHYAQIAQRERGAHRFTEPSGKSLAGDRTAKKSERAS